MPTYNLDGRGSNRSANGAYTNTGTYYYYAPNPVSSTNGTVLLGTGTTTSATRAGTPITPGVISSGLYADEKRLYQLNYAQTTVAGVTVTVSQDPVKEVGSYTGLPETNAGETNRFNNLRDSSTTRTVQLPPGNPGQYDWNLPPHQWSLPTLPTTVNEDHYTNNKLSPKRQSTDKYRRGRLWWKANPSIATLDANGNVTKLSRGDANRKYGFQFLWNPETIGTQVSVQLEATPSVQDRFLGVSGAFPATETISFTVRLDRTNDFACAQAAFPNQIQRIIRSTGSLPNSILQSEVEQFIKYYRPNESFAASTSKDKMAKKLVDLYQRGTIADIEYLYKAINGPGPGGATDGTEWMNGRGIKTADIGWLMPTLLHVDVGPLSYDGYVTALQVTHTAFTPSMVPIRSDVTISLNVLATASLTTAS